MRFSAARCGPITCVWEDATSLGHLYLDRWGMYVVVVGIVFLKTRPRVRSIKKKIHIIMATGGKDNQQQRTRGPDKNVRIRLIAKNIPIFVEELAISYVKIMPPAIYEDRVTIQASIPISASRTKLDSYIALRTFLKDRNPNSASVTA